MFACLFFCLSVFASVFVCLCANFSLKCGLTQGRFGQYTDAFCDSLFPGVVSEPTPKVQKPPPVPEAAAGSYDQLHESSGLISRQTLNHVTCQYSLTSSPVTTAVHCHPNIHSLLPPYPTSWNPRDLCPSACPVEGPQIGHQF